MGTYEIMYIVKPIENEAFEEVVKKFENLITASGGTVEKTDRWGKKHLAYEVQGIEEGRYVLMAFTASRSCIKELDRVMLITDEVLRHMIVRKGE